MHRYLLPLAKRLSGINGPVKRIIPVPAPIPASTPANTVLPTQDAVDARALKGMLDTLAGLIDKAREQRQSTAIELAQQSVELGVAIAERLVGAAIALDRQRLDQIVLASLGRIPTNTKVFLRGHPDDIALVQRQIEAFGALEPWRETLAFQRDDACARGKLVLEADDLFVDWDTQRGLVEMRNTLLDEIFTEA